METVVTVVSTDDAVVTAGVVIIGTGGSSILWKSIPRSAYLLVDFVSIKPFVFKVPSAFLQSLWKSLPIAGAVMLMKSSSVIAAPFVPTFSPFATFTLSVT